MLDIIATIKEFTPRHLISHGVGASDLIFIFKESSLGVTSKDQLPSAADLNLTGQLCYSFGMLSGVHCCFYEGEIHPEWKITLTPIRALQGRLTDIFYAVSALANHLHHWRSMHLFCGHCGTATQDVDHERAKKCPACLAVVYPRISPCVIVLIRRGMELLLVRSPHFKPGVFSLVAGFIEPGETVEQAVVREVQEEVGLRLKNIQYVLSQPWPFPDSLMLGFVADYESGELTMDGVEIEDGAWYSINHLPELPNEMSIARYLIDRFLAYLKSQPV